MKIGIVGASGLIGWNLFKYLRAEGVETLGTYSNRARPGLQKWNLLGGDPTVFDSCTHVVLSAAISNLDRCRAEPELAYAVNVKGNIALLQRMKEKGSFPVFLSSDQVFDGQRGLYKETDPVAPVNVYGEHKVAIEEYLRDNFERHLVFRLSKTYSRDPEDGGLYFDVVNPLREGKRIKAAFNQIYNPTPVELVSEKILASVRAELRGVYHLARPGEMSRYEVARRFAAEEELDVSLIERFDFSLLPVTEKRALRSSLVVDKLAGDLK